MIKIFHNLFVKQANPSKTSIGFFGGRRVDLSDMARSPQARQKLQELLILMRQIEACQSPSACQPEVAVQNYLEPKHQPKIDP